MKLTPIDPCYAISPTMFQELSHLKWLMNTSRAAKNRRPVS